MRKLTYGELISPYPIFIPNVGYVQHPTLKKVFEPDISEFSQNKYIGLLNVLCLTVPNYFKIIDKEDIYNSLNNDEKQQLCVFDLITLSHNMILSVLKSLSFFIDGTISYNKKNNLFLIKNDLGNGYINRDNFDDICSVIKQINYITEDDSIPKGKPKNKIAADILAKLNKAQEKNKVKKDNNLTLENMISSLCVKHNSYNMTNIWSLTVYQLYDQFFRQNLNNQIDISATRWAAWGQEPFDYDLWFKSMKNK